MGSSLLLSPTSPVTMTPQFQGKGGKVLENLPSEVVSLFAVSVQRNGLRRRLEACLSCWEVKVKAA